MIRPKVASQGPQVVRKSVLRPTGDSDRPPISIFPLATNLAVEIIRILKYPLDVMYYTRYDRTDAVRQDT